MIAFACFLIGSILFSVTLIASIEKSFFTGFEYLLAEWWGIATLVDLYAGFLLAGCWIFWIEEKKAFAAIWVLTLMVFGNFVVMVYLARLAWQGGEFSKLFTPKRGASPA